jgi:phosphotransferase system  glucose/maltose/N-acetylglucosamine-specific IIC component
MNMYPKSNNNRVVIILILVLVSSGILLGINKNIEITHPTQSSLISLSSDIKNY